MGPEVIDDIVGTDVLGISARRLDLLALPEREDDKSDEKQAEFGRIRASVQISSNYSRRVGWSRAGCLGGG